MSDSLKTGQAHFFDLSLLLLPGRPNRDNYNWGHRHRDDHRHSPAEVLGWVTGRMRTPEQLHRIFYSSRFLRSLDRFGYARFRRWKLYAEEGLARRQTVLWLYGDTLTLEYENAPLSQYTVDYQPDKKHFRRVKDPRHFETPYRSPQQPLWHQLSLLANWRVSQRYQFRDDSCLVIIRFFLLGYFACQVRSY